jgi:hypothetical protein
MQRKAHALVVLPWGSNGMSVQHRRWLARGKLLRSAHGERLLQALSALGARPPPEALGALRLWGQTGQQPTGWIAAADPVSFEARLDHLVLHALPELSAREVGEIFTYLQESLAAPDSVLFISIGALGYVRRNRPRAVASASPEVARGSSPEAFLPSGGAAGPHDRLQGEVQMCLYEAVINQRRAQAGMPPVNALWLWGGGVAQPSLSRSSPMSLPVLFADDPLFKGYWRSVPAAVAGWPGDLDACLKASPQGFVAVPPGGKQPDGAAAIDTHLSVLRRMLQRGRLRAVTVLFADGLRADRGCWDTLRLWRRGAPFPKESGSE